MVQRFQIEEIIVQDADGITFRALDTATGAEVAVRRFFPFGSRGGGLQEEEQAAYTIAIGRLAGVRDPALRSVVVGGCDPIDGIPYIATEWVKGELLVDRVAARRFKAEDAVTLVLRALDTSMLLSKVLAEEAVWVETDLHTIVIEEPTGQRGATFWLSPFKWLSGAEAKGYESIAKLIEEVMGWKGRVVSDQAGKGLGAWLKWLRGIPPDTSLLEVRQSLAALFAEKPATDAAGSASAEKPASDAAAPSSAGQLAKPVSGTPNIAQVPRAPTARGIPQPVVPAPQPSKRSGAALFVIGGLLLAAGGGAAWWFSRDVAMPPAQPIAEAPTPVTEVDRVNRRAAELSTRTGRPERAAEPAPASAPAIELIHWDQREKLIERDQREVTVSGLVLKTGMSNSGKTVYLLFSDDVNSARVGLFLGPRKNRESDKAFFESLVGKEVRATGKVEYRREYGDRLDITISSKDDVKTGD